MITVEPGFGQKLSEIRAKSASVRTISELFYATFFVISPSPWSSLELNRIALEILSEYSKSVTPQEFETFVIDRIRESFQDLKTNKTTFGGVRPQLGYTVSSYETRMQWSDQISKIGCISSLYFFIKSFAPNEKALRVHWDFLVPSIFKILDDSDALVKSMGCKNLVLVLERLDSATKPDNYLTKSNLNTMLFESLVTCFAYIPKMTTTQNSVILIKEAFKCCDLLIEKCISDSERDIKLATVIKEHLLSKTATVLQLESSQAVPILSLFFDLITQSKKCFRYVFVPILDHLVFPVLQDEFLYLNNCNSDMILKCVVCLSLVLDCRNVDVYRYDILAVLLEFLQKYKIECEILKFEDSHFDNKVLVTVREVVSKLHLDENETSATKAKFPDFEIFFKN